MIPNPIQTLKDPEARRTIFRLAWPTMTETALQTVVQYVDTAQVGLLGAAASAAVGLTSTTTWLVNSPIWAIGTGVMACIAQALGAGDRQRASRAADQSLLLVLVLGSVMTAVTLLISPHLPDWLGASAEIRRDAALYFGICCVPMLLRVSSVIFAAALRATGNTRTPMRINVLMNVINIVLNYLLINPVRTVRVGPLSVTVWGAGWGVTGAAVATAAAYAAGGILMFAAFRKCDLFSELHLKYDREVMGKCLGIGMPIAGERMISMFGQVVFTALVARLGTIAVAAHSIALTAESAFYVPGYGMQTAAATLSGYYYGAKDEKKLMEFSSSIMLIASLLMGFLGLCLFLFPSFFMKIFTKDPNVIAMGAAVLRIVAVSEPFYAVFIILEGTFNGVGDVKAPLVFALVSMWGVRILFTFICVTRLHLGLRAVWCCMVADNMTRFILMTRRYAGTRWKRGILSPPAAEQ